MLTRLLRTIRKRREERREYEELRRTSMAFRTEHNMGLIGLHMQSARTPDPTRGELVRR